MENNMDILETVVQNSLGSSFGNNSEFQNHSNQQPNQSVSITIYTDKRNFRTPKEMRDLHGSVEGVIILDPPPPANKVIVFLIFQKMDGVLNIRKDCYICFSLINALVSVE